MNHQSAHREFTCTSILEPLEGRRLFTAIASDIAALAPSTAAALSVPLATTAGGGSGSTGGGVISPIPPIDNTTVPVTINAAAGVEFSGSVGRLKNVTIAATLRLDAVIDWGDGISSTGTIKQVSVGVFQVNGKHTYKYGGSYAVSVSVSGRPIAGPGEVVPQYIVVFPTIHSKAIVSGPLAKPITTTGVTLNLTAGKPFTGSVGSFRLNVPPGPGVLSAGIDWGDGSSSAGTIRKQLDGSYKVIGSHTYQVQGTYKIATTIGIGPAIVPGPGPQPLFPSRLLGTIQSTAKVAAAPLPPDGTITLVNGVLAVRGTEKADRIDITQNPSYAFPTLPDPSKPGTIDHVGSLSPLPLPTINVTINGHVHVFKVEAVKSVTVEGLGGDDSINLHGFSPPPPIAVPTTAGGTTPVNLTPPYYPFGVGLNVPAIVHGGTGNDTIFGGNANDILFGDVGNDSLNGGLGTDVLRGGANDDTLTSSAGLDKAFGGDGDDTAMLALIPTGVPPIGGFQQVYKFGYIDKDVEHIIAPPVILQPR